MSKEFEIDVSGSDLLSKNYAIAVCEKNTENIKSFKFDEQFVLTLAKKYIHGKSQRAKIMFKVRVYCITLYYIFKSFQLKENTQINIHICRDFHGHERDISSQLKYFLEDLLKLKININYSRLESDSLADRYAYISAKDTQNLFKGYINLSFQEIEKFLNKNNK
jgi:hypothetical protein